MKKIAIVSLMALALAAGLSAQAFPGPGAVADASQEVVKVEGKLAFKNSHVALVAKDKTYYVGIPAWAYGFVEGLKDGATVKLEGYEASLPLAPEYSHLRVTKLTVGGKDYDFSDAGFGRGGMGGGRGQAGGMGGRGQGPGAGMMDGSGRGGRGR